MNDEYNNSPLDTADVTASMDNQDIQDNKVMAILCYLGWLWLIPFFARKNSPFTRFHLNQAFVLFICSIVISVASMVLSKIPFVGTIIWIVNIALFVFSIMGIVNAAQGKAKELPLIGNLNILN